MNSPRNNNISSERDLTPIATRRYRGSHRKETRGRKSGRARSLVLALVVILVGSGIMFYPKLTDLSYAWSQTRLAAEAAAMTLDAGSSQDGGQATAPARAAESTDAGIALPDGAVARIEIPAIGLKAYVVEGTAGSSLAGGPGHYPGTPLPGEAGNACIAGHRTMHGHPFQDLDQLQPGDTILTGTARHTAVYLVVQVLVVDPTDTQVTSQSGGDRLTLTTCHPKGSAAQRLVVVADLSH